MYRLVKSRRHIGDENLWAMMATKCLRIVDLLSDKHKCASYTHRFDLKKASFFFMYMTAYMWIITLWWWWWWWHSIIIYYKSYSQQFVILEKFMLGHIYKFESILIYNWHKTDCFMPDGFIVIVSDELVYCTWFHMMIMGFIWTRAF